DPNGPIELYRMKRVPFGTSASPYLLFITLEHHFDQCESTFPDTVKKIRNNIYVDDLLVSTNNNKEMEKLKEECVKLMDAAGMNIRKWRSNDAQLDLQWAPNEMKQATVLGVKWNFKDYYLALN